MPKMTLENRKNTKQQFKIVNKATNSNQQNPFQDGNSEELAEEIANYFPNKIKTIIEDTEKYMPGPSNAPLFRRFASLTKVKVRKEIFNMSTKSCKLDPIPTNLLKQLLPKCLNTIMHLVNISPTQGVLNNEWKAAIVRSLFKKQLWTLFTKNYRPVSNLCFLPKPVERCMLCQLIDHCNSNNLLP